MPSCFIKFKNIYPSSVSVSPSLDFEHVQKHLVLRFLEVEPPSYSHFYVSRLDTSTSWNHIVSKQKCSKDTSNQNVGSKMGIANWPRKLDPLHLLLHASIGSSINETFFAVPMHHHVGKIWVHTPHINLHLLHQTTKSCSSTNWENVLVINTRGHAFVWHPHHCFHTTQLTSSLM